MSGYAEDAFKKNLPEGEQFAFLPKPFSLKQLAIAVKETLGRAGRCPGRPRDVRSPEVGRAYAVGAAFEPGENNRPALLLTVLVVDEISVLVL